MYPDANIWLTGELRLRFLGIHPDSGFHRRPQPGRSAFGAFRSYFWRACGSIRGSRGANGSPKASFAFSCEHPRLAASALGADDALQPSVQHVTHVRHTADIIAMGACNGVLSTCAIGGYAMESRSVYLSANVMFADAVH